MNSMKWIAVCFASTALLIASSALGASTEKAVQLVATLSGVVQDDKNGAPVASKVKIGANELINLALGRSVATIPQSNEVLALASGCGEGSTIRIIVFDKDTSSNLATIAVASFMSVVESAKSLQFVLVMEVQHVGSMLNSINEGMLMLAGTLTVDTGFCLAKASATLMGTMDVTFTDDVGTNSGDVLIPKGKLVTGANLGTLSP